MAEKPALERLAQALFGYHGEHMIGGEQEIRDATYHVHHAVNLAGSEHYIVMSPRQVRASIEQSRVMKDASFLGLGLGHNLFCDPATTCSAIHSGPRKLASLVCVVDKKCITQ